MDEFEKIYKAASEFLKINEYLESVKLYEKAIDISPLDYRGWWGAAKATMLTLFSWNFEEFVFSYYEMHIGGNYSGIAGLYEKALKLADKDNRKRIELEYDSLIREHYVPKWDKINEAIRDGNATYFKQYFKIDFFMCQLCRKSYDISESSEEFKKTKLYQTIIKGKRNAEILQNIPKDKRFSCVCAAGVGSFYGTIFAAEKMLITDDSDHPTEFYSLKIDANKIVEEGNIVYNNRMKNGDCVYCAGKVGILTKKCKSCRNKQP